MWIQWPIYSWHNEAGRIRRAHLALRRDETPKTSQLIRGKVYSWTTHLGATHRHPAQPTAFHSTSEFSDAWEFHLNAIQGSYVRIIFRLPQMRRPAFVSTHAVNTCITLFSVAKSRPVPRTEWQAAETRVSKLRAWRRWPRSVRFRKRDCVFVKHLLTKGRQSGAVFLPGHCMVEHLHPVAIYNRKTPPGLLEMDPFFCDWKLCHHFWMVLLFYNL